MLRPHTAHSCTPRSVLWASLLLLLVLLPRCTSGAAPLDDTVSFLASAPQPSIDSVPFMEGWRVASGRAEDWADAIDVVQKRLRVSAEYRASFATPSNLNMLVSLARMKGRGRSESEEAQASAAGALMTLTERCSGSLFWLHTRLCRILAKNANAIPVLVSVAQHGSEEGRANAAGTLRNMARVDAHLESIVSAGAIPVLVSLAWSGSDEGKIRAVLCLESLATIDANRKAIVTAGAIPVLKSLVRYGSVEGKEAATRVLRLVSVFDTNITFAADVMQPAALISDGGEEDTEAATRANNPATNTNDKLILAASSVVVVASSVVVPASSVVVPAATWPDLLLAFVFLNLFTLRYIYITVMILRWGRLSGLSGGLGETVLTIRTIALLSSEINAFIEGVYLNLSHIDLYLAAFDWMVIAISVQLLHHLLDAMEKTAWVGGPLYERYDAIDTTSTILIFVLLLPYAAA